MRERISTTALVAGSLGLLFAVASIVALFWFDAEDPKPKQATVDIEAKRVEESKQAKERVWTDLKDKLPRKP